MPEVYEEDSTMSGEGTLSSIKSITLASERFGESTFATSMMWSSSDSAMSPA
jgi:hypothetical protein